MSTQTFSVGDLVEATKGEQAMKGRLILPNDGGGFGGLAIPTATALPEQAIYLSWLERNGYTVALIEKAVPVLPTKPGAYTCRTGSVHVLTSSGQWLDFSTWHGTRWAKPPTNYAPFTRLEPVAVTAGKVLDRVRSIFGPDALILKEIDTIAKEFGTS